MKGIILAGGLGTRLYPLTKAVSKQLLPVYDKPMIYYPLSTLMQAGIREVLIISAPESLPCYQLLFGDGSGLGLHIFYEVQPEPNGLAEALIIGERFIGDDHVALILGDNIFYADGLAEMLRDASGGSGAAVFGYQADDPERFAVAELDENGCVVTIEEKPVCPKSNYCVTGLYFYDRDAVRYAKTLKPSARGELEITELNKMYLAKGMLRVTLLGPDCTWLDVGTIEALYAAGDFIKNTQHKLGIRIACVEETAYKNGWITAARLKTLAERYGQTEYGRHLSRLAGREADRP